jgi:hypothetical protein
LLNTYKRATKLALALLGVKQEIIVNCNKDTHACYIKSFLFKSSKQTSLYPLLSLSYMCVKINKSIINYNFKVSFPAYYNLWKCKLLHP